MSNVIAKIRSVNVDGCALKGELVTERAIAAVTMQAMKDTEPFVPFLKGDLNGSARTETDRAKGLLIWGGAKADQYASVQYYSFPNKTRGTHVQAKMKWFDASKAVNIDKWIAVARGQARREK